MSRHRWEPIFSLGFKVAPAAQRAMESALEVIRHRHSHLQISAGLHASRLAHVSLFMYRLHASMDDATHQKHCLALGAAMGCVGYPKTVEESVLDPTFSVTGIFARGRRIVLRCRDKKRYRPAQKLCRRLIAEDHLEEVKNGHFSIVLAHLVRPVSKEQHLYDVPFALEVFTLQDMEHILLDSSRMRLDIQPIRATLAKTGTTE